MALMCTQCCFAYVLDWETASTGSSWTTGSPTVNNVNGSGINITITVAGDNIQTGTPSITNTPISAQNNTLLTDVNWDNIGADTLTFTISFTGTVTSASIDLLDIDRGNLFLFGFIPISVFQDEISGITASGTGVSAATLSTNLDNTISGSNVIGLGANGNTTNPAGNENDALTTGNLGISFTGTDINQISFQYTKGPSSPANPTLQRISLGDITFTVPEAESWVTLVLLGSGFGALSLKRYLTNRFPFISPGNRSL